MIELGALHPSVSSFKKEDLEQKTSVFFNSSFFFTNSYGLVATNASDSTIVADHVNFIQVPQLPSTTAARFVALCGTPENSGKNINCATQKI